MRQDSTAHEAVGRREVALSRRTLIKAAGGVAAAAVGARVAQAQAPAGTGGAAEHGHHPAARLRPRRRADHVLHRSRRPHRRSRCSTACAQPNAADPAAVDRRALVGGAGVERPGPLPRLERHPQQPPAALARGRRPRQRVPHAVEQQQRQHLRLPGPPALLRAPHPPRRALRARRLGHRDRGLVQRQAAQLAQRRRAASRRQLLVHRPALRRPALRGRARRAGRAQQRARAGSSRASASRRRSATRKRELPTSVLPRRSRAAASTSSSPRSRCPIPTASCFSPDYKKLYVASTGKGPGRHGAGRQGRHVRVRRRRRQQALQRQKLFTDFMVDGVKCGPDGVRCDVDGNVWCSSNAGRAVGYSGVTVWTPGGQAHRPHPPARGLRQRLLRRPQAQPPVHGGEPVALCGLRQHPGRRARLKLSLTHERGRRSTALRPGGMPSARSTTADLARLRNTG